MLRQNGIELVGTKIEGGKNQFLMMKLEEFKELLDGLKTLKLQDGMSC